MSCREKIGVSILLTLLVGILGVSPVFADAVPWEKVGKSRTASDADIGDDGALFIISPNQQIHRWDGKRFVPFNAQGTRIAVGSAKHVAHCNRWGRIYRYTGKGEDWERLHGVSCSEVGIGADGALFVIDNQQKIHSWDGVKFVPFNGQGTRIAVGSARHVAHCNRWGRIYRYTGKGEDWERLHGVSCSEVGIGVDGTIFVIDRNERMHRWDDLNKKFVQINGKATRIAVGAANVVAHVNRIGRVYLAVAESIKILKKDIEQRVKAIIKQEDNYNPVEGDRLLPFKNPPVKTAASNARKLTVDLNVQYGENLIYNPIAKKPVRVKQRSYNGRFVGETWRVKPGDTLIVNNHNQLPAGEEKAGSACERVHHSENGPHNLNTTNLHFHGFHVSPSDFSDDVLINCPPGAKWTNTVKIPKDHPAGTFWYHPHVHGATAMQVSSGMAGALIVEGGIDDHPLMSGVEDRIFVLQQMPYRETEGKRGYYDVEITAERGAATLEARIDTNQKELDATKQRPTDAENTEKKKQNDITRLEGWITADQKTLESEAETRKFDFIENLFGLTAWEEGIVELGWQTTINGQYMPLLLVQTGAVERWRMIHAGVREHIRLSVETPADEAEPVSMYHIAYDGLSTGSIDRKGQADLFPGYRVDVLIQFDKPGLYFLVDRGIRQGQAEGSEMKPLFAGGDTDKILAAIYVIDSVQGMPRALARSRSWKQRSAQQLPTGNMFEGYRAHASLLNPNKPFNSAQTCKEAKAYDGCQDVRFGIGTNAEGELIFTVGNDLTKDISADSPFDLAKPARELTLGHVDQWTITSVGRGDGNLANGHPFHIHVNPFEVISLIDCSPEELKTPPAGRKCQDLLLDKQTGKRTTTWKDTLFVPVGWTVTLLSKYTVFDGDFVYHCHILDHEDEGMMELVRITKSK